jgi:hypothetical protein
MTEEPDELIEKAKETTRQIADVIEACAPEAGARLALSPAITATAQVSRMLDKMATSGYPYSVAKLHAMGVIRSGPKVNQPGRER